MNKIFIEDGLSLYNKTGIGQYTQNIANILKDLNYDVIMPRKYFLEKIKNASIKRILYVLWLNIIFPLLLIFSGADKVIFTNYLTPIYKIPTKKYYPVIHDLWVIKLSETMSNTKRNYQTWILNVTKKNYNKIITVSETVKKEIVDFYKCSTDDVGVIYNYFSFGENPEITLSDKEQLKLLERFNLKEKEYILSVGSLNKRKNIRSLIEVYKQIETDKKLVVVGKKENEEFDKVENVIFTGYLEDEELKVLYKNALIFVFPSLYEGFGIPLIDAQSFEIPVLCSDIPVFKEIGGNSAEYFSLLNKGDLKEKLQCLLNNEGKRSELIELGNENKKTYNKDNINTKIKEVFNEIINKH